MRCLPISCFAVPIGLDKYRRMNKWTASVLWSLVTPHGLQAKVWLSLPGPGN